MGLIDEMTHEDKKALTRVQIRQSVQDCWNYMKTTFDQNMTRFWKNEFGLTPQDVADCLGTDAVQLFTLASAMKTMLNAIKEGAVNGETPMIVTPNEDGTVSLSFPSSSSSSDLPSEESSSSSSI